MEDCLNYAGAISWCAGVTQDVIPCSHFSIQFIAFLISFGLAVFDTCTDWLVVVNFKDNGFSNPLLPRNDIWLIIWLTFAGIGTFLTVVSILHEGINLLYAYYNQEPFGGCFKRGWNSVTRNETLSALTLWLQELPMLVLGILFVYMQLSCKSPIPIDVNALFLDISISVTVTFAAIFWRLMRSVFRVYARQVSLKDYDQFWKKNKPKRDEVVYPHATCAGKFLKLFYLCMSFEAIATLGAPIAVGFIWFEYVRSENGTNFDGSLAIYRSDHPLINISGTVIPPNGTFINLENINDMKLHNSRDIYCLRGFEYHPETFQIYFNAVDLFAVSNNADFCDAVDIENDSQCDDLFLYYASRPPVYDMYLNPIYGTGDIERLDEQCKVAFFDYPIQNPQFNTIVNVYRHLGRTNLSEHGEPVAVLYPDLNRFFLMGDVKSAPDGEFQGIFSSVFTNISCVIELRYLQLPTTGRGQIQYNYRDVINYGENNCTFSSTNICSSVHTDLVYGYLSDEYSLVQNTRCSNVTDNQLRPVYEPSIIVRLPC
ncbi:uncharacterized protein LOC135348564 [Halichondria panicea]|uniref:uncharacterized protein LOC135348564 n=1 Tax=Halichondria panicea TaxID=6063 RepID=UPI00312B9E9B